MNATNHHSLPSCQLPTSTGTERNADNKQQEKFRSVSAGSNGNAAVKRYEAPVPNTLTFTANTDGQEVKHLEVDEAGRSEKYGAKDKQDSRSSANEEPEEDQNNSVSKMESF